MSQEGFEPTTKGLRVPCSTAELLARWHKGTEDSIAAVIHRGDASGMRSNLCQEAPILKIFVPHTGQSPWVAGRPFFMVMAFASLISREALHFTQYPEAMPHLHARSDATLGRPDATRGGGYRTPTHHLSPDHDRRSPGT